MAQLIRIADIDELPPGKGKTIDVRGREVTVYNQEGRFVATSTWVRHVEGTGPLDTACEMPGHVFDVDVEDSPARLRTDELAYQVIARSDGVFVLVEDGHVHPGQEPRRGSLV